MFILCCKILYLLNEETSMNNIRRKMIIRERELRSTGGSVRKFGKEGKTKIGKRGTSKEDVIDCSII